MGDWTVRIYHAGRVVSEYQDLTQGEAALIFQTLMNSPELYTELLCGEVVLKYWQAERLLDIDPADIKATKELLLYGADPKGKKIQYFDKVHVRQRLSAARAAKKKEERKK